MWQPRNLYFKLNNEHLELIFIYYRNDQTDTIIDTSVDFYESLHTDLRNRYTIHKT